MDRFKIVEKIRGDRLCKMKQLMIKLNNLSHSDRLSFMKNIKSDEIDWISEIVLNFLNNNKSYFFKRQLLSSLKGLQIFKFILPLSPITLNIVKLKISI